MVMIGILSPGASRSAQKVMPVDSGLKPRRRSGPLPFSRCVTLDAAIGRIAGFAFFIGDFDAVDALSRSLTRFR